MDILTYIKRMNQLYGSEQQVASNPLNFPGHMIHEYEGGQLKPEEFYQWQSIPQSERPLTGAEGGRVYDTRKYFSRGQLVQPGPGRPGYQGKKVIGANQYSGAKVDIEFFNKVINNYKESVINDFTAGDMSKTKSWRSYLKEKYPKNWMKIQGGALRHGLDSPKFFQFSYKNKLLKNLINKANDGEKFVNALDIMKKVQAIPERIDRPGQLKARGFSDMGEWVDTKLPKLESREKKILKVLDSIIKNDEVLQLKNPNFKFIKNIEKGTEVESNLIRRIIGDRTGTRSTDVVANAMNKHPKMQQKKFRKIFDHMSQAHVNDFEGFKFSDAFDYATERRGGAAGFKTGKKTMMYKNPDHNIMTYALRHWDSNNFNDQKSRIQFFNKKTGKPIKWTSGLRLPMNQVYFTMDGNPMKWSTQTLKTHGKASGLFDEVIDITNAYYKTYDKWVSDGKGGKIKFGNLIGPRNMAIGHNAEGGIKAEPFKNLQLQSQKMNTGLYHATKHIKNKDLQKRVINNIYGDLKNLKGDKYIDEFIKNFPSEIGYKEAGAQIITDPKGEWLKWSQRKQAELFKVAGIKAKDISALNEMNDTQKISMLKKLGYKCRLQGGAGESVTCYMKDVEKTRADLRSPNVEVRAKALTKQTNALKIASKIPQIGKIIKTGIQTGTAGLAGFLNWTGVGQPIAYAIEGIVEGGFYDNARRKGYSHEQAMAETLIPGLVAGRPEGVPWHGFGGAEELRKRELYEIKGRNEFMDVENRPPMQDPTFGKVIGTRGKVKQYIDALEEQDRIYNAIARKEGAYDADTAAAAAADVQDLARSGAYGRVDRIMDPESMASQAYQTRVESRDALDQRRRREYLEKVEPRFLEREEKILSSPKQLEKRYREMDKMFPKYTDFTDEYINEIFASQGIKDPTQYGTYDQIRNFFETEEKENIDKIKQSYFADNFRLEKVGGGRVPFGKGKVVKSIDEGRRAFMKWLAGITGAGIAAGTGILKWGKVAGKGKTAIKAGDHILQSTPGMPEWYVPLINRIVNEGTEVTKKLATVEREIVHTKKIAPGEEVTVYQNLDTGNVRVEYGPPLLDEQGNVIRASNDMNTVHLEYKAPEVIESGKHKGKKTKSEFSAAESEPEVVNWDGDIEFTGINEVNKVDELVTDTNPLKQFAKNKKPTMKEIVESSKKNKYKSKLESDTMEQVDYIEKKRGPFPDPSDYADDMFDEFGNYIGD